MSENEDLKVTNSLEETDLENSNLEENEEKELTKREKFLNSGFCRALVTFGKYVRQIVIDIIVAIKDKPSILFGILAAFPGIFIGLFINSHINASNGLTEDYTMSGFCMFAMMLAGCINIYCGFNIASNRRLKSSILSAICTAIFTGFAIYWLYALSTCDFLWNYTSWGGAAKVSITCVIISLIASIVGTVGSFFFYDRNYKKD